MRKVLEVLVGGAALTTAFSGAAFAQQTSIATATGSVTIVQPITVSAINPLAFGRIALPSAAGTVIVSTGGVQTVSAGSHSVGAQTVSAASFMVTGDGAAGFSITPDTSFVMAAGTNHITVTTTASILSGSLSGSTGTAGTLPFTVGGTMSFASAQAQGAYSGTFHVTVSYN